MSNEQVCILYCRVSSDKQAREAKGSLDDQEKRCRTKAAELGLTVLRVQRDSESAWILEKRSQFQTVLRDARAGKFAYLVVDRMNRLTRSEDLGDYMAVRVALRQAGVEVVFAEKDYGSGAASQLMQYLDAYVSAGEQANRRKQSMSGKRTRVLTHKRPLPGSWSPYGYRWLDAAKTRADFDVDADGNPSESARVIRRIWHYFLYDEAPTLAGLAKTFNRESVRTPRQYAGVKAPSNSVASGPRWTAYAIRDILHNELYWGGVDGMVRAFRWAKNNEVTWIPAYAPGFVTPAEAARVHARLTTNQKYAKRNRKKEWHTLLHGGLARCGQCGWSLAPYTYKRPRADGSLLTVYRCQQNQQFGPKVCRGANISAETLDAAVEALLTKELSNSDFLTRFFAAWEADTDLSMATVREIETTLKETQTQIANQTARLATLAPGDALAAPVEANVRLLSESLPALEERLQKAKVAVEQARGNEALRAELAEWSDAWMFGFGMLSQARKREFLLSIGAKVKLYRDQTPRAQLIIALPTSAAALPAAPWTTGESGWAADVDLEEGVALSVIRREYQDFRANSPTPEWTFEQELAWYEERLIEAGYDNAAARLRAALIARGGVHTPQKGRSGSPIRKASAERMPVQVEICSGGTPSVSR